MKLKLSLILVALTLCLTGIKAENPFAKLAKIKNVQCLQFDSIPDEGIKVKNINIDNSRELIDTFDPKDIIILITSKKKSIDKLFTQANDICNNNAFETLVNVNDGTDKVRIYIQYGETRSTIAFVVADDEDGVVLSANIKADKEQLMNLLQSLNK